MANVSLTKHQEKFIKETVTSGRYLSTSEVVRDALRLLEEKESVRAERLNALRREIAPAITQIKEGRVEDGKTVFPRLRKQIEDKHSRS